MLQKYNFFKNRKLVFISKSCCKKSDFLSFFNNIVDVCFLYYSSGTKVFGSTLVPLWFRFGSTNATTYLCDYMPIMEPKT